VQRIDEWRRSAVVRREPQLLVVASLREIVQPVLAFLLFDQRPASARKPILPVQLYVLAVSEYDGLARQR